MNSNDSEIRNVSDTAYWVAFYRFIESERKDAIFRDPYAKLLIGEHGKKVSSSIKRRFAKYSYWSVIIRTPIIDDYILKYTDQGCKTVINLGAGLDTRPYRLALSPEIQWIEVDFPEIIALKNKKIQDQEPKCKVERIGLDLSDHAERERLFNELNHRVGPAIILTEGVIPYLTEDAVVSLANDLTKQTNFRLWISEYYSPELYPRFQSPKFRGSLGGSPFQFFPSDWFVLFENCGWTQKERKFLHDEAIKHKRKFPLPWWVSVLAAIFGEQKILGKIRENSAYIVFEKNNRTQSIGNSNVGVSSAL